MPRGVYERKPWMRTYGRGPAVHQAIKDMLNSGSSMADASRSAGVSFATVAALRSGDWNPTRNRPAASVTGLSQEHKYRLSAAMKEYWKRKRSIRALAANPETLTRFNALTGDEARELVAGRVRRG